MKEWNTKKHQTKTCGLSERKRKANDATKGSHSKKRKLMGTDFIFHDVPVSPKISSRKGALKPIRELPKIPKLVIQRIKIEPTDDPGTQQSLYKFVIRRPEETSEYSGSKMKSTSTMNLSAGSQCTDRFKTPAFEKCSTQQLLRKIDSLWQMHCQIQFRGKAPGEMESWRDLFHRLSDEREALITQKISSKEDVKKPLIKKTKTAYVDENTTPKPPRNVRRARKNTALSANSSRPVKYSHSTMGKTDSRKRIASSEDKDNVPYSTKVSKRPPAAPLTAKVMRMAEI